MLQYNKHRFRYLFNHIFGGIRWVVATRFERHALTEEVRLQASSPNRSTKKENDFSVIDCPPVHFFSKGKERVSEKGTNKKL